MAKRTIVLGIKVDGARETLAAFRGLPKDANRELRLASVDLSRDLARDAASAGRVEGAQAALVAGTVKAMFDRVPSVQAGGSKRLGSRQAPAWKLLFGSEFGSNQYQQFPHLHMGNFGIWFFPTVEKNASTIAARWLEAADDIIRAFSTRG